MLVTYNADFPRRLKTAFIGCGGHALRNVYPAFQYAPVDLAAVCDLNEERARACARHYGARTTYTDYRRMLDQEQPEIVFVVTNYDDQGRPRYPGIAMDAMRAGAHVWIEKPPASSKAEIEAMMAVSQETGKHVVVGFKKMFNLANRKAKAIISSESFGPVAAITARYPQPLPPREERQNAFKMLGFLDHIVHPHSVLFLHGGPIQTLRVQRHEGGAAVVLLRFMSGAVGTLLLSHGQSGTSPFERTEILGNGENVVVENNLRVYYYRRGAPEGPYGHAGSYYDTLGEPAQFWEPEFSLGQPYNNALFVQGYVAEVNEACACALENRAPRLGGLDAALEMLRVYEAYARENGDEIVVNPE